MKSFGNSIEKGMLPLLDISMMLFGMLIILLTLANFDTVRPSKESDTENAVSIGISMALGERESDTIKESENELESNPANIVEELVTRAMLEGRLIMLRFDTEGVVNYNGKTLYDGEFYEPILDMLKKSIEENKPMLMIGYPVTKGYNKTTLGHINTFKNKIETYTDSIFFIGIPEKE